MSIVVSQGCTRQAPVSPNLTEITENGKRLKAKSNRQDVSDFNRSLPIVKIMVKELTLVSIAA